MQILVDVPDAQVKLLLAHAEKSGMSCEQVLREVVAERFPCEDRPLSSYIGLWARTNPGGIEDGLAYQDRLRAEW